MTDLAPSDPAPSSGPGSLEQALAAIEQEADVALRALGAAVREAKRAKSAAAVGQVRELGQALDAAVRLADRAAEAARDLRRDWRFDVPGWFTSGGYTKELLATASDGGVRAFESDERILSYPVVVQVVPAEAALVIDKKKDRRVRPSVVVRHLAALQDRPPNFKAPAFIESLARAYDLVVAERNGRLGSVVRLVDVHRVLTLLPGSARDYSVQEFVRDIYLLDQSGVVEVKDGRRLTLPASALTRSIPLVTVTRGGQTKVYAGIAFGEPSR